MRHVKNDVKIYVQQRFQYSDAATRLSRLESELAGSSDNVGCILISHGIMYCQERVLGKHFSRKILKALNLRNTDDTP